MLGSAIIARFNLQVDDSSELSTSEELALVNEVYNEIADDRPWEWLKATFTGTTSTSEAYIDLPSDFKEVVQNLENRMVVFVGEDYEEYEVIPFSSRRDYRDQSGFCYVDIPTGRLYFTLQPTAAEAIEYDYIKRPDDLTTATAPLVTTTSFGNMIAYGMSARFPSIEQAEKGTSYATDNRTEYFKILNDQQIEDSNIKLAQ